MPRALLIAWSLFALPLAGFARPPATVATTRSASELSLKTDRVVLFKDGHGLVIKSGSATADSGGRAFITDVPDSAVLGCFWATTTGGDAGEKILAMRAEWDEKKETRDQPTSCITMAELLHANQGKAVTLELTDKLDKGESVTISGKIIDLLEVAPDPDHPWMQPAAWRRAPGETPPPPIAYTSFIQRGVLQSGSFTPESFVGEGTLVRDLVPGGGDFVVVSEADDRRIVLPVDHVQSIRGGADVVTTTDHQQEIFTRSKRLSFDFGKDAAGKNVSLKLFYFTPGLRWIPTYRISGELKDKADLALQGEILNEVTDIDHAGLDLVVGVPNFRFDDTVSPLTLEQTMRGALLAADINVNNSNMMGQQFSNRDMRARGGSGGQPPAPPDAGMTAAPELSGSGGEQDLFVYSINDFSLKKGARATVPLWQQQADLRHVYTFDVNTHRSRAGGQLMDDAAPGSEQQQPPDPRRHRGPNRIVFNQVWHQLELTNTSKVPWTTGAALMLRNALPIGQDLLTYTPPTGKSLVPVTVAVDIRGTVDEQQTARQENALHFDGSDYIKITKKGTITLTSYRAEKSNTKVTLSSGGHVTTVSDNGTIKYNDFRAGDWDDSGYLRPNEHSDVSWDFVLDPGATKSITYELTFYTR